MPLFDQDIVPTVSSVDCILLPASRYEKLLSYLRRHNHEFWGISAAFKPNGDVKAFGLATKEKVYVINEAKKLTPKCLDQLRTIANRSTTLVGFNMDSIALGFYRTFHTRFRAADLGVVYNTGRKESHNLGLIKGIFPASTNSARLQSMWNEKSFHLNENVCLRAWIALQIAELEPTAPKKSDKINTLNLSNAELDLLSTCYLEHELSERAKPAITRAEFSGISFNKDAFEIRNSRYKTRIRSTNNAPRYLVFKDSAGKTAVGYSRHTDGKTTHGVINGDLKGRVKKVIVVGKESPSSAEEEICTLMLKVLLGQSDLKESRHIRLLWKLRKSGEVSSAISDSGLSLASVNQLNTSQKMALAAILGPNEIVLCHGPPGTGKTTVIAAAAKQLAQAEKPLWIVAHSNVAVKNIAEKLIKGNIDFKLIVSQEFYKEWHEEIYKEIGNSHLIRSNQFPEEKAETSKLLGATKVILCTLSMLSNPLLKSNGMFDCIPMQNVVVDEASQINIFEYLPIFIRFYKTLAKMCFFGDPNQLPPFQQDQRSSVKSIFDLGHLSRGSFFLQEQYRIPKAVGDFISEEVYQSRLLSRHPIVSGDCVTFVDASGQEESKRGSYVNRREIQTIVHLMRYYRDTNYAIITPYDAQRAAIIKALVAAKAPSDRVFNVDSFQGNEADYVLISIVRDKKIGFLSSDNRINVMLTRFKKGMVVVANQKFVNGLAKETLLGKLSIHWSKTYQNEGWINWAEVANKNIKLPGVIAC